MTTKITNNLTIPFQSIDWSDVDKITYEGDTGVATWQTQQYAGLRIRIVEYSAGYVADHWCQKGHIVHCLEGEVTNQLDGEPDSILKQGMTYVVSDEQSSHRSVTQSGVKLLIIDGDFLKEN